MLERSAVDVLTREDGFFETLGAVGLLAASITSLLVARHARRRGAERRTRVVLLALAFLFFVAAGEEISWGQHLLHFGTPADLATINRQHEANIHDIGLVEGASNFFFNLFWLVFGLLVPLAARASDRARRALGRVLPIVPVWVGVLLLGNYVFSQLVRALLPAGLYHGSDLLAHTAVEIKEANAEVLFAVGMLCVLRAASRRTEALGRLVVPLGRDRSRRRTGLHPEPPAA